MTRVFTSQITETIPIPHDAGHAVTIRKLNPKQLHRASIAKQAEAISDVEALGGFAKVSAMIAGMSKEERAESKDPLHGYDRVSLIALGVTAWTYRNGDTPVPIANETAEDLDDETQDVIARAVLKLARPKLFQTPDEAEAAEKNE